MIEPQLADYSPQISKIANTDTIALSRFAYLRRRGMEMVLESPRAGALFRITDPKMAAALVTLSKPQKISRYRKERGFPGLEFLGLLMDCQILFKLRDGDTDGLRPSEGDPSLVLWDFHDFLFHTHSTEGRQANPIGGLYSYSDLMAPLPAVRPRMARKSGRPKRRGNVLRPRRSQLARRAALDTRLRRWTSDHVGRIWQASANHCARAREMDSALRLRRGRPGNILCFAAVSIGRRSLRAGTLSRGQPVRGLGAGFLPLRCGAACIDADRSPPARPRCAAFRRRVRYWRLAHRTS